jgi:glyoxylase-like metal-dependent hydrolase (beta-lactamase superfamily II)
MLHADRRLFLSQVAGLSIAAALPARAQSRNNFKIGDIGVRVLDDGHMMVPRDRIAAIGTDEALLASELLPRGATALPEQFRFSLNVTLLEIDGKRVLIDAGAGGTWVPDGGKLGDALTAAGIDPGSIDHVVLTHAHPDHLWGVVDDFDNTLRFPNAAYTIPNREFEFWMSATEPDAARAAEGVTAGARRVLKMIEPKLTRTAADAQVLPGITYLDAAGHTPGQCAVMVHSGGQKLLIATDTLFHPVVSVAHPHWRPAQDMDGDVAVATRLRLLDIAATEQARVLAYHIADLSGNIVRAGNGYIWLGQP